MSRAEALIPLLARLEEIHGDLRIVETGTIRADTPEHREGDGHATLHVARFVAASKRRHEFHSVDCDEDAIGVCATVLLEAGLTRGYVLHMDDSVGFLKSLAGPVHFAYLDSANEADHTWAEFDTLSPNLSADAFVVVDDSSLDLRAHAVNKGRMIVAWAWDTRTPVWPLTDRSVALAFGSAVLEAVPEEFRP